MVYLRRIKAIPYKVLLPTTKIYVNKITNLRINFKTPSAANNFKAKIVWQLTVIQDLDLFAITDSPRRPFLTKSLATPISFPQQAGVEFADAPKPYSSIPFRTGHLVPTYPVNLPLPILGSPLKPSQHRLHLVKNLFRELVATYNITWDSLHNCLNEDLLPRPRKELFLPPVNFFHTFSTTKEKITFLDRSKITGKPRYTLFLSGVSSSKEKTIILKEQMGYYRSPPSYPKAMDTLVRPCAMVCLIELNMAKSCAMVCLE
ncbi:unnamed protein product [Vicia faba]|uniref:Uncharacterized protein n=1 Tax=Vicia faba TaxID=3906 RepID=A0AAV1A696_VICFA|nr:unnamed protein product [Vicia faba]